MMNKTKVKLVLSAVGVPDFAEGRTARLYWFGNQPFKLDVETVSEHAKTMLKRH